MWGWWGNENSLKEIEESISKRMEDINKFLKETQETKKKNNIWLKQANQDLKTEIEAIKKP